MNTVEKKYFLQRAEELFHKVQKYRRYLHENPELSFEEYNTQNFIVEILEKMGISSIQKIAGTGVKVVIEGAKKGRVIGLRADIDALPILEQNRVSYSSKNKGVMHACGHDFHTATLLGVIELLNSIKSELQGTYVAFFQPAEEKIPGGAQWMIREGVLDAPKIDVVIGQHVSTQLPWGVFGFAKGTYMSSVDQLEIKIIGKGGHAAVPEACLDPVPVASEIILALQQIVSRKAGAKRPAVVSIGSIETPNGSTNILPDEVHLQGTLRCLDESFRMEAKEHIYKICKGITMAHSMNCELNIIEGYPVLYNHPEVTDLCKKAALSFTNETHVVDLDIWMASEDFAYYAQKVPSCFYRIGIMNEEKGILSGVHTPTFDVEERALIHSVGFMAYASVVIAMSDKKFAT